MKYQKKISSILGLLTLLSLASCASKNIEQQPVAEVAPVEAADEVYNRVPAADCDSSKYKECREARKNDIADRYMLAHNGTLFRRINKASCAITENVQSFKISQHPNDIAVIYYKKGNNLYLVNLDREYRPSGQCPSAKGNTQLLMEDIAKYTVTSNIHSTIVNAALDNKGNFKAWDNTTSVYTDTKVKEFQMNDCFGSKGLSFNSFVLFTQDYSQSITKVKVDSSKKYVKDNSKATSERYSSVHDFKNHANNGQGVCK